MLRRLAVVLMLVIGCVLFLGLAFVFGIGDVLIVLAFLGSVTWWGVDASSRCRRRRKRRQEQRASTTNA